MKLVEQLKSQLNKVREELNTNGFKYDTTNYDVIAIFEDNYKRCVENLFKESYNNVIENYDIFEEMCYGVDDEQVITELTEHINKEYLREGIERCEVLGCCVEKGHTLEEYREKFGELYDAGELWDFSKEDFEEGAIEPNPDICYWLIEVDGEPRYFEADASRAMESLKLDKELDEDALREGTSNFPTRFPHGFPLLVFYTYDEVYDKMKYTDGYPQQADFEDEDGHVDMDAYYDALDTFEEDFWDKLDCCALDEDDVENLENDLYDFNQKTKEIAYEKDVNEDGYQEYGNYLNLEDVELKIEPGYYEAAYIDVDNEDSLDAIEDEAFRNEQIARIKEFMEEMQGKYHLSHYELAYGPASNGETGYRKVKEIKEEDVKEDYCSLRPGDILSTEDFLKWHDMSAANYQAHTSEFHEIYNIFKNNGCEDCEDVDVCYEKCSDDDKKRITAIVKACIEDDCKPVKAPWESLEEKKKKEKVHVTVGGDPEKSTAMLNTMLDAGPAPAGPVALGEAKKGREEYCVMVGGDNYDCFDDEEEAVKCARRLAQYKENEGQNVKVLLVEYDDADEEVGVETIWALSYGKYADSDFGEVAFKIAEKLGLSDKDAHDLEWDMIMHEGKNWKDRVLAELKDEDLLDRFKIIIGEHEIEESLEESYPSFSELEEWCKGDVVEMIHTIKRIRNDEMTEGDRLVYNDFGLEAYDKEELEKLLGKLEDEVYSYLYDSGDFSEEQIDEIEKQLGESLKEDKDQDKLGLPREVTFKASEVALDTDDEDPSDRLSDMLSDKYGFCHYGFKIDVKKNENGEPSEFRCYDIDWDTSESLKEDVAYNDPYILDAYAYLENKGGYAYITRIRTDKGEQEVKKGFQSKEDFDKFVKEYRENVEADDGEVKYISTMFQGQQANYRPYMKNESLRTLKEAKCLDQHFDECKTKDGKLMELTVRMEKTPNYTHEYAYVDYLGKHYVGHDKWMNRPWYKFTYGNALEDALSAINKELAHEACREASNYSDALRYFAERI